MKWGYSLTGAATRSVSQSVSSRMPASVIS